MQHRAQEKDGFDQKNRVDGNVDVRQLGHPRDLIFAAVQHLIV